MSNNDKLKIIIALHASRDQILEMLAFNVEKSSSLLISLDHEEFKTIGKEIIKSVNSNIDKMVTCCSNLEESQIELDGEILEIEEALK